VASLFPPPATFNFRKVEIVVRIVDATNRVGFEFSE
jgi:hypothetical protein